MGDHPVQQVAREKLNELIRHKALVRQNLAPDLALMRYAMKHHRAKFDDETFGLLKKAIRELSRFPTSALRLYEPGGRIRVEPEEVEVRHPISAGLFLVRKLHPMAEEIIQEAKDGRLRILPIDYDSVYLRPSDASALDESDDNRKAPEADAEKEPPDPPYDEYDKKYGDSRKHDKMVASVVSLLVGALGIYGIGAFLYASNPAYLILAMLLFPVAWIYNQRVNESREKYRRWTKRWREGIEVDGEVVSRVDRSQWKDDWCRPWLRLARYDVDWVDLVDRDLQDEDRVFLWEGREDHGYAVKREGRFVAVVKISKD